MNVKKLAVFKLLVFFPLFFAGYVEAEVKTFVREYTYQASEVDTKESCQIISLKQVKRLLLEELGTYLESFTEVTNYQLTKDKITVLTAGIVQSNIVEEKWDGKTYWVKAKITTDPDSVAKSIDNLRRDWQKTKELEELRKKAEDALRETERLKKELQIAKADKRKIEIVYREAVKELNAAEWAENGFRLAEKAFLKESIDAFSRALQLDSKFRLAYAYRGVAYSGLGLYLQAIEDFNRAIELTPKDISDINSIYYVSRGNCYKKLGDHRQAAEDFNRIVNLKPESALDFNTRGDAYAGLGNHHQAIKDFTRAIELNPGRSISAYSYLQRGSSHLVLSNINRAIADFTKAIDLDSEITYLGLSMRAVAYAGLNNNEQAMKDITRAIELQPENLMVNLFQATVYKELGDYQKAVEILSHIIEVQPGILNTYLIRGQSYERLGKYSQAIEDLNRVIENNPNDPEAFYSRGVAYGGSGNHIQALDDFNRTIELNPQHAGAYYSRGVGYSLLGKHQQAIKDFNRFIEIDPKSEWGFIGRGQAYFKKGDFDKALIDLQKAIALNPKSAPAHKERGFVYIDLEKYKLAISDFDEALKVQKDPKSNSEIYVGLAISHFQIGKNEEAKEYYRKAVEIEPSFKRGLEFAEREKGYTYTPKQKQIVKNLLKLIG
jgi:tetratricopeptide (TPR) repeat protein